MSFSSWDDGSWVRVLKNEDEDDLLDEDIRRDVEQQVEEGVTEAERKLAEQNAENERAEAYRKKKRKKSFGRAGTTFSSDSGVMGRKKKTDETLTGKKEKKTDEDYLREYEENFGAGGKYEKEAQSVDYRKDQQRRRELEETGSDSAKRIQATKDQLSDVKQRVTGVDPNKRYRDQEGYGKVTELPTLGEMAEGAKDKVVSGAKKVKDVAGQAVSSAQEAIQPVIQGAVNYKPPSSSAYPEAEAVIAAKVNMMLTEAQQNLMENKPINNKAKISEWVDVLQSSTTDPEQKKLGEQWKKILEASS